MYTHVGHCMCMHTYMSVYVDEGHLRMFVFVCMYIPMCVCIYTCIYKIRPCIHIWACTYIQVIFVRRLEALGLENGAQIKFRVMPRLPHGCIYVFMYTCMYVSSPVM